MIGRDFQGVLRLGGADTQQLFVQDRLSLRNDFTRFFEWKGSHSVKGGVVLSRISYDVTKFFTAFNPVFRFRSTRASRSRSRPATASATPTLDANNTQYGLFLQDDWSPRSG